MDFLTVVVVTAGRLTAGPAPVSDSGPDAGFARDMQAHHARPVQMALGMATPEQLQKLPGAADAEADRLFAEMIRHYLGGVAMARAAACLPETAKVRDFAASIVKAQTAEITALKELRAGL